MQDFDVAYRTSISAMQNIDIAYRTSISVMQNIDIAYQVSIFTMQDLNTWFQVLKSCINYVFNKVMEKAKSPINPLRGLPQPLL